MESFVKDMSIVFVVASFLAYMAVVFKKPLIIGYILCGVLIGPWGLKFIQKS